MIIFLLAAALKSSSAPLPSNTNALTPITIFGRELPECVNPSQQRTLAEIVWSCLVTIFACSWIAVHPNVPEACTSGWKKLKDKVKIMICALLAPELVTMWALRQRLGAAKHVADYNKKFYSGGTPQTTSILGWFGAHDEVCYKHNRNGPWTLTHGFLLEMNGLSLNGSSVYDVDKLEKHLLISEAEINDKSKGDFLTKLFVVLQTTWFIFQVLARWVSHLPVTELEVVTLGFAFLNIVTYVLWWNKPQNMQVPICVDTAVVEGDKPEEDDWKAAGVKGDARISPRRVFRAPFKVAGFIIMIPLMLDDMMNGDTDSLFYSSVNGYTSMDAVIPMSLVSLIFGGLHFIPLGTSSFPSIPERTLWMTSAICITIEPALLSVFIFLLTQDPGGVLEVLGVTAFLLTMIGAWVYVVARFALIILAFTTLRDLRPSVYQNVDWTAFMPHL